MKAEEIRELNSYLLQLDAINNDDELTQFIGYPKCTDQVFDWVGAMINLEILRQNNGVISIPCDYYLKPGVFLQTSGDPSKACSNINLTNELALYYLEKNPDFLNKKIYPRHKDKFSGYMINIIEEIDKIRQDPELLPILLQERVKVQEQEMKAIALEAKEKEKEKIELAKKEKKSQIERIEKLAEQLSSITDEDLVGELKRRGFTGLLTYEKRLSI